MNEPVDELAEMPQAMQIGLTDRLCLEPLDHDHVDDLVALHRDPEWPHGSTALVETRGPSTNGPSRHRLTGARHASGRQPRSVLNTNMYRAARIPPDNPGVSRE